MPGNIETVISFDPDEERENLILQRTSAPNEHPIDNNHKNTEVILLDISPDKKWICYISHQLEEGSQIYKMKKKERRTYLTRRRFTSINPITGDEETVVDNLLKENIDLEHFSMDITDKIKIVGDSHCKFLSISGDGNYVVLSFCERIEQTDGKLWPPKNPNCLVFESKQGVLKLSHKIKCDGRAVFLTKNTLSLALVQSTTIKVYDNFPNNISISFLFDLHPFITTNGLTHENAQGHKSYIENAPWIDINKPVVNSSGRRADIHEDTKRIITFSRHIRHNVLITPFVDGIVRVWSMIEDGVRLTSFSALNQHVMAFSKHYKYTAAYVEGTRAINIYNVKSGLLVYQLKSRAVDLSASFEVAHIRFCYDGRYIAMSGWEGDQVVFEVWYIEAEELIYRTTVSLTTKPNSDLYSRDRRLLKVVQPFVTRGVNSNGDKCLKGFYTSFENGNFATTFIELDIDRVQTNIDIKWVENSNPTYYEKTEILNNLDEYDGIKCGHFEIKRDKYLIRFGKHTVQLWRLNGNETSGGCAFENDDLIYIRAYKGPHYGIDYSFRETWQIQDFSRILFIGGNSFGRMLVNIKETDDQAYKSGSEPDNSYHTEEIFLPVHELLFPKDPVRRQSTEHLSSVTQNSDEHNEDELKFDYHKLESACQALHYLSTIDIKSVFIEERTIQYRNNHKVLCEKTEHLVKTAVKNIDKESNFFSTIAGSRTLAMLASFEKGKEIIKLIVIQPIPISIFSYAKPIPEIFENPDDYEDRKRLEKAKIMNAPSIRNVNGTDSGTNSISVNYTMAYRDSPPRFNKHVQNNQSMVSNENVLTVLIEDLSYEMYQLLFNRILADSKKLGPGCLSSLTDALLLLQVEGNVDLLLSSSKNLSYLHIEQGKLGALKSEITHVMKVKTAQKEYISRSRNLETHAIMEQIQTYSSRTLFIYKIKRLYFDYFTSSELRSDIGFYYRVYIRKYIRMLFDQSKKDPKVLSKVCVVPLPHLNSYSSFPEDRPRLCKSNRVDVITYKDNSAFVQLAIDQDDNSIFRQGDTVLEVMLEYKWKQFARWRFIAICSIHALYYVSYSTGVLFSQELFYHDSEKDFVLDSPGQIISVVLMGISIIILWGQELRQFWNSHCRLNYFLSCYNWIDMASFIFPIYTLLQLVNRWDYFNEVCSISTLILWTHAILRLRAISYFGITLEIIIQLCRNVASVLMIMMLVIFAFSHAIFVLLRLEPDEYFREQFEGTYTSLNGTLSGETTIANVSSDNVFNNIFKTISQVWFFVYGVWDSLQDGEAGDNKVLICISIVFSFITVLIFFNLVIALMSSTVEDVNKLGKKVWVSHFAAVISEIELLWSTKGAKHCRKNNPMYIYYIGSFESVKKQENKLKAETDALEKKLGIDKLRLEATNLVNC